MATARPPCMISAVRLAFLLLTAILVANAHAETLPRPHPRIVNGVLTEEYPAVGALLLGTGPDTAGTWCSGTMIGCSTFLTAAHCVDGRSPADFYVFLPQAGMFSVVSIAKHPSYDFPAADVAVLKLGAAVDGVRPNVIETDAAPPTGTPGIIVGYGRSGDPNFDYGLKRVGAVVTAPCTGIPAPGNDITSVCWDFTNPLGPEGTNSNTCNADSGGPLFTDLGSGTRIAGITSGGSASSCQPTDHSYDTNIFNYHTFIQTAGGSDLANTSCGTGPQVGDAGTTTLTFTGTVSAGNPDATHSFTVPGGTTRLRVAMNAIDDVVSDFDLYVRAGSAPTTVNHDCGKFGPNQFGICEFAAPASGPWHILVDQYSGAGTYQLTVTLFATACAAPGSDGSPCDDGNPCTDTDICQAGTCAGSQSPDGTSCSDGNTCTGPDTCQAGICDTGPLADGTPCDDSDPCSRPDSCQAGTCTGIAPALTCNSAGPATGQLQIENRSPDTRDRLAWLWKKGAATTLADFGTPTTTTPYTLCLYDSVSGTPQRRLRQAIPPGSRWKAFSRGFRYRDLSGSAGGLQSIVLTEGVTGRASIQVRGKGDLLELPGLPFAKQPNVIVQLLAPNACWNSTFSTVTDNNLARFRAKSD